MVKEFKLHNRMNKKIFQLAFFSLVLLCANLVIGQVHAQDSDFLMDWSYAVDPSSVDGKPTACITSDNEGNVYQFFTVSGRCSLGGIEDFSFGRRTVVAFLVKTSPKGEVIWTRKISGAMVKANALTLKDNRLYLVARCSTNGKPVEAEQGETGNEPNVLNLDPKDDDNILVVTYDLGGVFQSMSLLKNMPNDAGRSETITKALVVGESLYLVGISENIKKDEKQDPSFNGISIKGAKNKNMGVVFVLSTASLSLEKCYSIYPNSDGNVYWNDILASGDRILTVGYTDDTIISFNEGESIQAEGTAVIYAELDPTSNQFKHVRALGKARSWSFGNCLAQDKDGLLYLGGLSGEKVQFALEEAGVESAELNGAFLAQWDPKNEKPTKLFPIGTNNEDNTLKAIVPLEDGLIAVAGNYYDAWDVMGKTLASKGDTDLFLGLFDPKSEELTKLTVFGSSDTDEIQNAYFNQTTGNIYLAGYYGGEYMQITDGVDFPDGGGFRSPNYFFAMKNLVEEKGGDENPEEPNKGKEDPNNNGSTTAVEDLQNQNLFTIQDCSIIWQKAGLYTVYNLNGVVVARGYAQNGTELQIPQGIYVIKFGAKVVKVILH